MYTRSLFSHVYYITFYCSQDLTNLNYNSYVSDKTNCNNAIVATIVSTIRNGITANNVVNMYVYSSSSVSVTVSANLRTNNKGLAATACTLQYNVQIPGAWGVSYTQLSNSLKSAVSSGAFTTQLEQFATTYNAPELRTTTSTTAYTWDYSTNDNSTDNKSVFTVGVIVGIVIGCTAALVMICLLLRCYFRKRTPNTAEAAAQETTNPGIYIFEAYVFVVYCLLSLYFSLCLFFYVCYSPFSS